MEKPTLEHWLFSGILLVIALLAVYEFTNTPGVTSGPQVLAVAANERINLSAQEQFVFNEINKLRSRRNMPPLKPAETLMSNASAYGNQLSNVCGPLNHSRLEPHLVEDIEGQPIQRYGENLAIHQDSLTQALDQLERSPSHYATIVGDYSHVGVSVIKSNQAQCGNSIFVVQHFAKAE